MKKKLTDKEKACLIYGYARGLAQASKEQGYFKDWRIEEVTQEFLGGVMMVDGVRKYNGSD